MLLVCCVVLLLLVVCVAFAIALVFSKLKAPEVGVDPTLLLTHSGGLTREAVHFCFLSSFLPSFLSFMSSFLVVIFLRF